LNSLSRRPRQPAPRTSASATPADRPRSRARGGGDPGTASEAVFLARVLDITAGLGSAEERLASLLQLIAATAGSASAAAVVDGGTRHVATSARSAGEDAPTDGLAAWLERVMAPGLADGGSVIPAPVSVIATGSRGPDASGYVSLAVPGRPAIVLGFDFGDNPAIAGWQERFPASLARHAGAGIALVTDELAVARELDALRARDADRIRFVATVAHELRTPLTGLGGYLDLILAGKASDPAVQREFLERGRDIVASIDELVDDLLELSRLESGALHLELGPCAVIDIARRVLEHLAPIAAERSVEVRSILPQRLRAARGDRRRIEQILTNVVGNALKFTPAGGTVELAAWFEGSMAVVVVRDDGQGISDVDRVRIFERFYRMPQHDRVTGTGLGLPIARELARAMGGDLDVASIARTGSSFVLILPGLRTAPGPVVHEVMTRTLDAERAQLEEQGMLRRLQAMGREAEALRNAPPAEPVGRSPISPRGPIASRDARGAHPATAGPRTRLRIVDPGGRSS
jgi:signal transduction histidine kinase